MNTHVPPACPHNVLRMHCPACAIGIVPLGALRREYENEPVRSINTAGRRAGKQQHALASVRGQIGAAIEDLESGARTEPFVYLWVGRKRNVRITVTTEEKR